MLAVGKDSVAGFDIFRVTVGMDNSTCCAVAGYKRQGRPPLAVTQNGKFGAGAYDTVFRFVDNIFAVYRGQVEFLLLHGNIPRLCEYYFGRTHGYPPSSYRPTAEIVYPEHDFAIQVYDV